MGANHDQPVIPGWPCVAVQAEGFPKKSLHAISTHRIADPSADRQTQSGEVQFIGACIDQQGTGFTADPLSVYLGKDRAAAEAV